MTLYREVCALAACRSSLDIGACFVAHDYRKTFGETGTMALDDEDYEGDYGGNHERRVDAHER